MVLNGINISVSFGLADKNRRHRLRRNRQRSGNRHVQQKTLRNLVQTQRDHQDHH
ncbi:MAG: hypothetical protein MZU97_20450 [Bacillus subtilis]|nr:hypothetical protein [Bacillus subtilis]